jgi:hypothetical protein
VTRRQAGALSFLTVLSYPPPICVCARACTTSFAHFGTVKADWAASRRDPTSGSIAVATAAYLRLCDQAEGRQ